MPGECIVTFERRLARRAGCLQLKRGVVRQHDTSTMKTPMKAEDVTERFSFARRRLDDLLTLNGGNLPGADGSERQQLLQEFFFHLIGSVDVLGQTTWSTTPTPHPIKMAIRETR